ncbi:hypothetical protein J437_LFUL002197 [Ladona fulva]|uniref:Uncharacterized protein n=1 Tax=Ladona fulva TaxID=123851 RepID=A0A8K0JV70_LADFU|nr:hypothetical protein J437_LFUL002197 [Ladona fulva]
MREATPVESHNKKKVACFVSSSQLFPTATPALVPPTTAGSTGDGSNVDVGSKVSRAHGEASVKADSSASGEVGGNSANSDKESGRQNGEKSSSSPRLTRGTSSGAVLGSLPEEKLKPLTSLPPHGPTSHRTHPHISQGVGATRSRSSDCLEKGSPLSSRRSQGESPLTTSPLARRGHTNEEATEKSSSHETVDAAKRLSPSLPKIGVGVGSDVLAEMKARQEKRATIVPRQSSEESESGGSKEGVNVQTGINVRLRSTGLSSPTNGMQRDGLPPLSPVLKNVSKANAVERQTIIQGGPQLKTKPPPIAPKPRPWSVVGSDQKSGECSLPSDGSSTNTSAANTPDSSGDALDESTDSGVASSHDLSLGSTAAGEKRSSVRELAASLSKGQLGGGGELSPNKILEHNSSVALSSGTGSHGMSSPPITSEHQDQMENLVDGQALSQLPKKKHSKTEEENNKPNQLMPFLEEGNKFPMTEFSYDDVIDV